jgi:hypothetical protein
MVNKQLKQTTKAFPKHEPEVKGSKKNETESHPATYMSPSEEIAKAATAELLATGTLAPAGKPEDQNAVKAEDQKSAPVVKKKSDTVVKWRAQDGFKPEQVITLLTKDNPKRRGAGDRFAKYTDGMSVQAYIDVMKESMKRTAKQTMGDIRWDYAAGFISIK